MPLIPILATAAMPRSRIESMVAGSTVSESMMRKCSSTHENASSFSASFIRELPSKNLLLAYISISLEICTSG